MLTRQRRLCIAEEIIRRVDTVTLMTCEEVEDIRKRALAGEFDDMGEELMGGKRHSSAQATQASLPNPK